MINLSKLGISIEKGYSCACHSGGVFLHNGPDCPVCKLEAERDLLRLAVDRERNVTRVLTDLLARAEAHRDAFAEIVEAVDHPKDGQHLPEVEKVTE